MSLSSDANAWEHLGYWFEFSESRTTWVFRLTRAARHKLSRLFWDYVRDPRHAVLSEHDHYGPYSDLKIVTWSEPRIDGDGIWGSMGELSQLASLIDERLLPAQVGEVIRIDREYFPSGNGAIEILVLNDDAALIPP